MRAKVRKQPEVRLPLEIRTEFLVGARIRPLPGDSPLTSFNGRHETHPRLCRLLNFCDGKSRDLAILIDGFDPRHRANQVKPLPELGHFHADLVPALIAHRNHVYLFPLFRAVAVGGFLGEQIDLEGRGRAQTDLDPDGAPESGHSAFPQQIFDPFGGDCDFVLVIHRVKNHTEQSESTRELRRCLLPLFAAILAAFGLLESLASEKILIFRGPHEIVPALGAGDRPVLECAAADLL